MPPPTCAPTPRPTSARSPPGARSKVERSGRAGGEGVGRCVRELPAACRRAAAQGHSSQPSHAGEARRSISIRRQQQGKNRAGALPRARLALGACAPTGTPRAVRAGPPSDAHLGVQEEDGPLASRVDGELLCELLLCGVGVRAATPRGRRARSAAAAGRVRARARGARAAAGGVQLLQLRRQLRPLGPHLAQAFHHQIVVVDEQEHLPAWRAGRRARPKRRWAGRPRGGGRRRRRVCARQRRLGKAGVPF